MERQSLPVSVDLSVAGVSSSMYGNAYGSRATGRITPVQVPPAWEPTLWQDAGSPAAPGGKVTIAGAPGVAASVSRCASRLCYCECNTQIARQHSPLLARA